MEDHVNGDALIAVADFRGVCIKSPDSVARGRVFYAALCGPRPNRLVRALEFAFENDGLLIDCSVPEMSDPRHPVSSCLCEWARGDGDRDVVAEVFRVIKRGGGVNLDAALTSGAAGFNAFSLALMFHGTSPHVDLLLSERSLDPGWSVITSYNVSCLVAWLESQSYQRRQEGDETAVRLINAMNNDSLQNVRPRRSSAIVLAASIGYDLTVAALIRRRVPWTSAAEDANRNQGLQTGINWEKRVEAAKRVERAVHQNRHYPARLAVILRLAIDRSSIYQTPAPIIHLVLDLVCGPYP